MLLHSKIIGEGHPLLILHGFLGMGDNWKSLGNQFVENGYEVHLIDHRNHGRSFHSDDFSYEIMVADLYAYCEHYQLEEIALLGHSMGGKAAMLFAVTHPNIVSKLIIADISPRSYPLHHQAILYALEKLDFTKIESRNEADASLSEVLTDLATRQFLLKNLYWVQKGELGLRFNLSVLIENIEEVGKALPEKTSFDGETLFLYGAKSGYFVQGDEIEIKRHFPNSKIDYVSKAGHWLHAENPIEFYQFVVNFL